jgi:hypothetical protein
MSRELLSLALSRNIDSGLGPACSGKASALANPLGASATSDVSRKSYATCRIYLMVVLNGGCGHIIHLMRRASAKTSGLSGEGDPRWCLTLPPLALVDGDIVVGRTSKLFLRGTGYNVQSLEYPFEGDLGAPLGVPACSSRAHPLPRRERRWEATLRRYRL